MAGELKHKDVDGSLSKAEWEAVDTHIADGQQANDMLYFNGTYWIRATPATIAALLDHGNLQGKGDDDHSQYHNNARGDARYLYKENTDEFTPDGDYEPATKKYVDDNAGGGGTLDPTLSSDHTYDGETITFTAGTNLVFSNCCYVGADEKLEKCDKDAIATVGVRNYIALATIAEDASGLFLRSGVIRDDSLTFTIGHGVWIGDSGALVGSAAGPHSGASDVNMCVGYAYAAHKWDFWGIGSYRLEI